MTRQPICRVKPSSTWLLAGFFLFCSLGIATAPMWSDTTFYPWERLDVRWLIGAAACAAMTVWLLPRYLLRLKASQGLGLWVDNGALFLVSRAKPIPIKEIDHISLEQKLFPTVIVRLRDGKSVRISAWAMDIPVADLMARIEDARKRYRLSEPPPLS